MSYIVVFKNVSQDDFDGVITWTPYADKAEFNRYQAQMREQYQVVEEDVSRERAIQLCSTPEATSAAILAKLRELNNFIRI